METQVVPSPNYMSDKQAARETNEQLEAEKAAAVRKFGANSEEVAELIHSQQRISRGFPRRYYKD